MNPENLPKISIVTVSYNQGQFIEDNILSVINQNYPNLEHIIIDAGSTDGTLELLKKYDKHLNWVSEPDNGQSDGLNKGFKKATGEIIGWFNSDDRVAPGALHKVARFFMDNPDEIAVVGDINLINENGDLLRRVISEPYEYNNMINKKRGVTQPSTFLKKMIFGKIGYLNESLHYAMDFDLFLRVSSIRTVPYLKYSLADFRLQPAAKSTNGLINFRKEHIKIARSYNASYLSKGIRSDMYVILSNPFREITWFRNMIRRLKGLEHYDEQKFN